MGTYIVDADITDLVLTDFEELAAKVAASDAAVNDMAERKGVIDSDEIETSPVHHQVKEWAKAWVGRELCFDAMGKNNVDVSDIEKYEMKYNVYRRRLKEIDSTITKAILRGDVNYSRDRAGIHSSTIFRS